MIAITLGIIFIVIVLLVFGVPLKDYVSKQFEVGPFKVVKPDTTYTTGTPSETGKSGQCFPTFELTGSSDAVASEIAKLAYNCFSKVVNSRESKVLCACVVSVNHDISRDSIITYLGKYPKLSKGGIVSFEQDPVEALVDNWEEGYDEERHHKLEKGWTYRICADADEVDIDDDDLMITGKDNCDAI